VLRLVTSVPAGAIVTLAVLVAASASFAGKNIQGPPKHPEQELRTIGGRASIIDGDGVEIDGVKIRLFGVDAPEVEQYCDRRDGTRWRCGQYATVALDRLAGGKDVSCLVRDQDRYGRMVAVCTVDGLDLGREQVRNGWALAYRHYSTDYVSEEQAAQRAKTGVWSSRFLEPWAWRDHVHH
jgi:endonuclease YncB( thermonuclease family)